MSSTLVLVATISLVVSLGLLRFQHHQGQMLKEQLKEAAHLVHTQSLSDPLPVSTIIGRASVERVERSRISIISSLEEVLQETNSPLGLLKALPDFLEAIQDLDAEELHLLAHDLKVFLASWGAEYKALSGMINECLVGLAAEQDPDALLKKGDAKGSFSATDQFRLSSLARRDAQAAIDWIKETEMADWKRSFYQKRLVTQLLLEDNPDAILALKVFGFPWNSSRHYLSPAPFLNLSENQTAILEAAWAENADPSARRVIGQTLLQSYCANDFETARAKATEMEFTYEDLKPIFDQASIQKLPSPPKLIEWIQATPGAPTHLMSQVLQAWGFRDLVAPAKWLNTQPASDFKDQAIFGYVQTASSANFPNALEWTKQITDAKWRKQSYNWVIRRWQTADPESAEAWLRENSE